MLRYWHAQTHWHVQEEDHVLSQMLPQSDWFGVFPSHLGTILKKTYRHNILFGLGLDQSREFFRDFNVLSHPQALLETKKLLKINIQYKVLDGNRASQLQGFRIKLIIIIIVNLNYLLQSSWWKIFWTNMARYIPACLVKGRWHLHEAWLSRQWGEKGCCKQEPVGFAVLGPCPFLHNQK